MTTFVLVHGAWSGAEGFRLVRPLLQAEGHDVYTPGLTGVAARRHLASPQVTLSTHIADVVNVALYEDLSTIVLLGFSYGGLVVAGAVEHIAERVAHLVFLDAFVPSDGESIHSLIGAGWPTTITVGAPWSVPPAPRQLDDPDEEAFINARRTPQPLGCFIEPVRLTVALEERPFTRTYIKATADGRDRPGGSAFWSVADRVRTSPAWAYHEIATTHMVGSNRPRELADLLLRLA